MRNENTNRAGGFPALFTPFLIAIACAAGYFSVLGIGFLSDDFNYLYGLVEAPDNGAKGAMFFRPLGIASLRLDLIIWGGNAFGYHLTNLILHFAAAWGVAFCAGRLISGKWAGLVAGLVFALHPIHPEAVSWISGRFDVLCGALLIWSLDAFLISYDAPSGKGLPWRIVSCLLFATACVTKEMAYAFPFVIAALVLIIPPAGENKPAKATARLLQVIPFFVVAVMLFALRAAFIGGIGGYSGHEGVTLGKMLYIVLVQPFYWLFLPFNRSLLWGIGPAPVWLVGIILVSPLALIALRPAWRVPVFGAVAVVLITMPVAVIGYVDLQMQSSRFLYIPSLFFAIMAAGLFTGAQAHSAKAGRVVRILIVIYLMALLLTLNQNNFAWEEAGRVARGATTSAVANVEKYGDDWGTKYKKLIIYNVPDAYLGAYVFREGLITMLRHRTGSQLDGVEIVVIIEEIGTFENVGELKLAFDEQTIVWFFNDADSVFEEVTEEETLPVKSY